MAEEPIVIMPALVIEYSSAAPSPIWFTTIVTGIFSAAHRLTMQYIGLPGCMAAVSSAEQPVATSAVFRASLLKLIASSRSS